MSLLAINELHWEIQRRDARIAELEAVAGKLFEAVTMVRDADEDCIRDHLTRMPPTARGLIDAAVVGARVAGVGATS